MKYFINFSLVILFISCSLQDGNPSKEELKSEVIQAEKEFTEMAQKEGISKAFLAFAAEDGVLNRNDIIIKGKEAMKKHFDQQGGGSGTLVWKPDFVDVAKSGDLAYTYGKYTYTATDSTGNEIKSSGIFHTVWKRQQDGSWKFVWD